MYSTEHYSMWFDSKIALSFLAVSLEKVANKLEGESDQQMVHLGTGAGWFSSVQGGQAGRDAKRQLFYTTKV